MKVQVSFIIEISHNVYIKVPTKSVSSLIVLVQTKLCNATMVGLCPAVHVHACTLMPQEMLEMCNKRLFTGVGLAGQVNLALNATSEKPQSFFMIFYLKIVFIWLDQPGYNKA